MSKIGLDVDNVLADWLGAVHVLAAREHGLDVFSHMSQWWSDDPAVQAVLATYVADLNLYPALIPIQDAVAGAGFVAELFDEVYYITGRPRSTREMTLTWLQRWRFPEGQLIYPHDAKVVTATRLGLTCMVDDHPETIDQILEADIRGYLFLCYNTSLRTQYMKTYYTVTNWTSLCMDLIRN